MPFKPSLPDTNHLLFDFQKESTKFIEFLKPTLRPNSCSVYKSSLKQFYLFVQREKIFLPQITRSHIELWMKELYYNKLSPVTRTIRLMYVRAFLDWLNDSKNLGLNPFKLIRNSDFPQIPIQLPKPMSVELDIEIQKLLNQSACRHQRSLLIMRKTGIRIGELSRLSFHCLRENSDGTTFLKVPLGKLHNERMVPIDADGVALVKELQVITKGSSKNKFPQYLLWGKKTGRISEDMLRHSFRKMAKALKLPANERINPHRFRHTYATELLNAGMSLQSIMWLLGHRSMVMTLRYAAVTQVTVLSEYQRVYEKLKSRYPLKQLEVPTPPLPDPIQLLTDIGKLLMSTADSNDVEKTKLKKLLLKRIRKLQQDLKILI